MPDSAVRSRAWRESHPGYDRAWRLANPDKALDIQRRHREANPEARKASVAKWRSENREQHAAYQKNWREANRERMRDHERRYRTAKAGVLLTVQVDADHCGVCQKPLTAMPFPDPMSTTIGHEPPLSVVAREGWKVVAERPEHWMCNRRKWAKPDYALEAA